MINTHRENGIDNPACSNPQFSLVKNSTIATNVLKPQCDNEQ